MKKLLGILAFAIMLVTATKPVVSAQPQVVASKTDHTITPDAIAKTLAKALEDGGAGKNIDVKLFGNNRDAAYAYATPIILKVEDLQFDPKAGTFNANLNFESEGQALSPSKITGRFDEMVDIPTLKRRLFQGDVIAEDDIVMIRVPSNRMRKGTVEQSASLVGRTPFKVISANRPILLSDVAAPSMVQKGDQITLRYISGNLSINTLGEALDSGAVGEKIRVKNSTSNKVVQAEIKNKELAMVQNMVQTDDDRKQ